MLWKRPYTLTVRYLNVVTRDRHTWFAERYRWKWLAKFSGALYCRQMDGLMPHELYYYVVDEDSQS